MDQVPGPVFLTVLEVTRQALQVFPLKLSPQLQCGRDISPETLLCIFPKDHQNHSGISTKLLVTVAGTGGILPQPHFFSSSSFGILKGALVTCFGMLLYCLWI